MGKLFISQHPLIQHKLSILRNIETSTKDFRELVNEIAMLMTYEATRDLPMEEIDVKTPCGVASCNQIAGRKLAFVPILRAGLGMVEGALSLVPAARVGHIGLYRDEETLKPVEYYCKLPKDIEQRDVFVLDAGLKIYSWRGKFASPFERFQGTVLMNKLWEERNKKPELITLEQGEKEMGKEFFSVNICLKLNLKIYKNREILNSLMRFIFHL